MNLFDVYHWATTQAKGAATLRINFRGKLMVNVKIVVREC